jgi:hypothetical protein
MTLPIIIGIAAVVVIVGGYLFLRFFVRVISPCPGCILEAVHQKGGSASYTSIYWWFVRNRRGFPNEEKLQETLRALVQEGKLQSGTETRRTAPGEKAETHFFLTDTGKTARLSHAAVPHLQ